jgi:predicted acetyltransferase
VNVHVAPADERDRECLGALLQLYAYDFSEVLGLDVGDDGRFEVPSLDPHWTDPLSHAFLIRVDARLAGFALVHGRSRLSGGERGDDRVFDMAEFFVVRKYRRRGVGERAAVWLFDRFRGPWEVRQKAENRAAVAFWRRVIGRYAGDQFGEVVYDDARWRGPVQRFDSATLTKPGAQWASAGPPGDERNSGGPR